MNVSFEISSISSSARRKTFKNFFPVSQQQQEAKKMVDVLDIRQFYQDHFDSIAYATTYVSDYEYEMKWFGEDFYHRLFAEGKLRGQSLLDVGCGPTVRPAISGSAYVEKIYLSDYLEPNRISVKKWIEKQADALDYTAQFKYVAKLEGISDIHYLEKRVRDAVKAVLPCDILADRPLYDKDLQFDIVTSSFCLDGFPDDKDYFKGMKNLASLIKPGGRLALVGTIGGTTYTVGKTKFPSAVVDVEKLKRAVTEPGLEIIEFKERKFEEIKAIETDNQGLFTLLAKKP